MKILWGVALLCLNIFAADGGSITGQVVDGSNGEPMVGATVRVDGTEMVTWVDINGSYTLKDVPEGIYTIMAEMGGFSTVSVQNVQVKTGMKTTISMEMKVDSLQEVMVVTAEALKDSEVGMLRLREKSLNISDAISEELISKSGSSTAADAVTKVTGASIVGGKHVFIRGLGNRYTTTQLNGTELPTADPDTKSFQMDLLPTKLIQNIVTQKSFTADKPGNFSGGIVDIGTKEFPGEFMLDIQLSGGYNDQSTGKTMLADAGGLDWRGQDPGDRKLPTSLRDAQIPDLFAARRDADLAQLLDQYSKAFGTSMSPESKDAPLDQGASVSTGNRFSLGTGEVGFLASATYSANSSSRPEWETARWRLTENVGDAATLQNQSSFVGSKGTESVQWGGLFSASYLPNPSHELGWTTLYSKVGEASAETYQGQWPEQFSSANAILESRVQKYSDRAVISNQMRGQHVFPTWNLLEVKWNLSHAKTTQDEPDTRIFTSHYADRVMNGQDTRVYSITASTYNNPARYYRSLEELSDSASVDFVLPINLWNEQRGNLKWGYLYQTKDRSFEERRFEYVADQTRYNGDADEYFVDQAGLLGFDEQRNRYLFGTVLQESPDSRGGDYSGDETLNAAYVLGELPITDKTKIVAGLRYETDEFTVENGNKVGSLDDKDTLPSFGLIQALQDHMNLRFSFGRTLARPTFREKAPYTSYDFIADGLYVGNPDLERTLIDNYDLRWEWFRGAGEIVAVSAFYKDFTNPIEKVYNIKFASEFGEKTYKNVDQAEVYGLELEGRIQFEEWAVAHDSNHIFGIGGNLALIKSEVKIPDEEYEFILQRDPEASQTRKLQGQSPFLINLTMSYDHAVTGTSASLNFNMFGERLEEVGFGGAPSVIEKPRKTVDFIFSQPFKRGITLNFSAKNLLNESVEFVQEFKGVDYIQSTYKTGRSFSLTISINP
ncbi:MAG: TonB-dependent receptor [Acidobacteria bacterium]|nr:TonB-dependent receptor [Acidobacteriota bacterium]